MNHHEQFSCPSKTQSDKIIFGGGHLARHNRSRYLWDLIARTFDNDTSDKTIETKRKWNPTEEYWAIVILLISCCFGCIKNVGCTCTSLSHAGHSEHKQWIQEPFRCDNSSPHITTNDREIEKRPRRTPLSKEHRE